MKNSKKKNDIILVVALLLIAVTIFTITTLTATTGNTVVVTVDGSEVGRYSLSKDIKTDIITENNKKNTLVIEENNAYISYADCPDKVCVSHRKISKDGESIICLPHKLVISIESN